ncbi:putative P-loop containing nucleoside triphosphate hydrolase, DNA2/NAM7 helicase, helicase [Helianthus annuus]|uniref:P-loop containing nucleoside triphosphate hydrolase n=1 Tax=Helianthus annuus TaxID=4232 RepID=A0A9K3HNX6_HELAN|nr:probable helicase MAGATAMA 3 [Helianthus annuus]XP_021993595.1 probable helicase MAGATAMA 3 [Helianthus annuus]KAF5781649.1 putative P-loop containing nucleoside triphosphate hydrolase [Helianthus annuus]KAJ0501232.1 putative P-loop containing nucleoside triphosphate hydrolase, DNA2/NAM7 helicase, helicase [Helianthus annuus]KAJ0517131.1 putative P-loop containing nucleoside triphosphate hydrolase, DNA2/NAM7 helicase, helicase [Helianthus annuus]KAJ0685140.1 putative P-loop containing nucle
MAIERNLIEEEGCLHRFYRIVLGWDYYRLLTEYSKDGKSSVKEKDLGLKQVKETYKDVDDYLATFEPLLFEEVKAQIRQRKDAEEGVESTCNGTEWKMGVVVQCHETDGFHLIELFGEDWSFVSQNDLLLLSNEKFEVDKLSTAYAFALVEHRLPDKLRLRLHLDGEIKRVHTNKVTTSKSLSKVRSRITEQKSWYIQKICSLSTIAREYVAMRSISFLPYKDVILKAADSIHNSEDEAWKISKPLMEYIQTNHNSTQLEAIRAGLSRRKFVLIQGPPGTGKTQTILGLLSAILHATPARIQNKGKISEIKRGPDLHIEDKKKQWAKASPWLTGINPRDAKMPVDGDDGFFPTTGNDLKPEVVNSNRKYRVRVLVCAPSNSALDEIVLRLLSTGIRDENDHAYAPKIVRIGLKAHHSVQAVSMDYLVEQKLAGMDFQTADKQKQGGGARDRDTIRASIMDESAIVFSTLSFSGSSLFTKLNRSFDIVVIDEAAQAVEPATLVPLASGCKQVFLVGDPVQLPATVISPVAEKFGYSMSLFKRFQKAGYPVQMLKTQYRMHPEIRSFPSKEFYDGELEDGSDVKDRTKRLWHKYRCFGPFCFFDIHEGEEKQPDGSGSWVNDDEVDFVLLMYHKLVSSYPELKSSSRLAIISPYRHQVKQFRRKFMEKFGVDSEKVVDINTVDGFQGREKDVAIFSCVRASKERGIGFVADFRRMNVGITRARASVLVVGSADALRKDEHWKNLITSAEERNCLFKVSKPYADFFNDDSLASMRVEEAVPDAPDDVDPLYDLPPEIDHAPPDDDYGDDAGGDDGGMDD